MKTITDISDFIFIEDEPKKADIIFIPGGSYSELGEKAAKLWHNNYAPLILPSGKNSPLNNRFLKPSSKADIYTNVYETECDFFVDVLTKNDVNKEAILKEDKAENTYQNAFKSRELTDKLGLKIDTAIICCKNFHSRRCLMYYQWAYPETELLVCSSEVQGIRKDNWFTLEKGIDRVMNELMKSGEQFRNYIKEIGSRN